jgi:hypothetical protein
VVGQATAHAEDDSSRKLAAMLNPEHSADRRVARSRCRSLKSARARSVDRLGTRGDAHDDAPGASRLDK